MDARTLNERLIEDGVLWVVEARQASRPLARTLTPGEISTLRDHVDSEGSLLRSVRVRSVSRLENPPFYGSLPGEHRASLIDFAGMDAITFVDTIVAREAVISDQRKWNSTLFHELVYVAQYAMLGVEGFVTEYVYGFAANGLRHRRIPVEIMAYRLQERFDRGEVFSLTEEVGSQLPWPP